MVKGLGFGLINRIFFNCMIFKINGYKLSIIHIHCTLLQAGVEISVKFLKLLTCCRLSQTL